MSIDKLRALAVLQREVNNKLRPDPYIPRDVTLEGYKAADCIDAIHGRDSIRTYDEALQYAQNLLTQGDNHATNT